jgi:hypothetical protein
MICVFHRSRYGMSPRIVLRTKEGYYYSEVIHEIPFLVPELVIRAIQYENIKRKGTFKQFWKETIRQQRKLFFQKLLNETLENKS